MYPLGLGCMLIRYIIIVLLLLWGVTADAAIWYISPTGNDTTGDGSTGNPYKTLDKAMTVGSGGDTVIYKDGTYNYAGSEVDASVKNGSAGAYTIIKAENDGGAVITQSGGLDFTTGKSYVQVEGLKFNAAAEKKIGGSSNHLKFLRCAFQGGPSSGNVVNTDISNSSYVLFEDCWWFGTGGRYNLLIYYCDHIIVRRCVFRHDGGWSDTKGDPEAATNAYTSGYVYYQNSIVINSTAAYYHNPYGAFYQTTDDPISNISWEGCIALNGTNSAFGVDPKSGASTTSVTIKDCVAHDYQYGIYQQTGATTTVLRATVGETTADTDAGLAEYGGTMTASYCNLYNNAGGSVSGPATTYSNAYSDGAAGTGNVNVDPYANGLLYLPRQEDNSYLATQQAGGRMGALIDNAIGVSGTLYGDEGWNTNTGVSLWPFPNEDRIKTDMASVSLRGFATTGLQLNGQDNVTLTSYIWEYLGNELPSGIYGPDVVPSAFSFTDNTGAALSMEYTSDNVTVAGIDNTTTLSLTGAGCEYSINGAAFATADDNVALNDNVALRVTSSGSYSTAKNCVLNLGGVTDTWYVTTLDAVNDPVAPRMRAGSMTGGWR